MNHYIHYYYVLVITINIKQTKICEKEKTLMFSPIIIMMFVIMFCTLLFALRILKNVTFRISNIKMKNTVQCNEKF